MASEAASNLNGVYDSHYGQPVELAASTPTHAPTSSQTSGSAAQQPSQSQQQKADPQEIGWYFVEQYYTTLSKTPERIHLFYSKKSQLVTGIEAEKVVPAVGTKAISEKIKELDIQDCKVRILNVDSQSSFDNIVVQVIGEMSNKSQPHHKFVQTFVLATQPNGYYVLNDIFRYLNDEEDEIIDEPIPDQPASTASDVEEPPETPVAAEVVDTVEAVHVVDAKLDNIDEVAVEVPNDAVPASVDTTLPEKVDLPVQEPASIPQLEEPPAPEPTPVIEATSKPPQDPPVAAPSMKKTWANMVGNKAPAIPALPSAPSVPSSTSATSGASTQPKATPKGTSQPAPAVPKPSEAATAASASRADEWQTADHGKKTKAPQTKSADGVVHAYLKNITEKVDARELRQTLEKYGELKYFDVSRPRNCAFVEFADPAGFAAAVAANPHDVNGESINVEERRPRPNTYTGNNTISRGASNAGRGRGNFQGRGGNQGNLQREKGTAFPVRGGKSGNVTPKGQSQNQAA